MALPDLNNLTEEEEKEIYGFNAIRGKGGYPDVMSGWNLGFLPAPPSTECGGYVIVDVQPASIEQHHQVTVIDENGIPLRNISVIFGYHTGEHIDIVPAPTINAWTENHPSDLNGNHQKTTGGGYAQHTTGEGGEKIHLYNVEPDGVLLPCPAVLDASVANTGVPGARFIHTGVSVVFQRRRANVFPRSVRLLQMEERVFTLETNQIEPGTLPVMQTQIDTLEESLKELKKNLDFVQTTVQSLLSG